MILAVALASSLAGFGAGGVLGGSQGPLARAPKKQRRQRKGKTPEAEDRHCAGEGCGGGSGGGPGGISVDEAIARCGKIILGGLSNSKVSVVREAVALLDGLVAQGGTRVDDLIMVKGTLLRRLESE